MRYIHERPGWPNLRWDLASLAEPLAAIRHRQGILFGRMEALGLPQRDEALLESLTADAIGSSAIEGEILDRDEVRSSVARRLGLDAGGLEPVDRRVEGMTEIVVDATKKWDEPLTEERLFGWHGALFPTGYSGMQRISVGAWRGPDGEPMQVVSGPAGRERIHFEAPTADRLAAEVGAFLDWFEGEEVDDVLRAGIAHLRFVTIHPFDDGNGRIARAIADLALARSERSPRRFYSMSAQIRRERRRYYEELESAQRGGLDVTPWLHWFLGCLDRAIEGAESTLASVLAAVRFWDTHAREPFNERQRDMIDRLLRGFEGKLTTSKWAKICKCSQDTALRDVTDLLSRGVLRREEAGGRSTSYTLNH